MGDKVSLSKYLLTILESNAFSVLIDPQIPILPDITALNLLIFFYVMSSKVFRVILRVTSEIED